jgi:arylsulfatase A-like enzyme
MGRRLTLIVVIALLSIAGIASALIRRAGGGGSGDGPPDLGGLPGSSSRRPPNVVVILTNDQRWDTLWAMPTVQRQLVGKGVTFANGFVVNPSCCPSRASILTGQYAHTTGVFRNHPPNGGFDSFNDRSTLPIWLHEAGYETALIGEYLNGYTKMTYVPPGWDRWFAFAERMTRMTKAYYDYKMNSDGVLEHFGNDPSAYSTDVLAQQASDFVATARRPFFLYLAPAAPHEPAIAPPRYANRFRGLGRWRPPSYNEPDETDKPPWKQSLGGLDAAEQRHVDELRRAQYRALLAVDDAVGTIVRSLRATHSLKDTIVFFLSDNGYLWGEHGMDGKGVPYDESIRVPFVVRYDRLVPHSRIVRAPALNIDIAPTIAELAHLDAPPMDGTSLAPILSGEGRLNRREFLVDHVGAGQVPTFCALRSRGYMYAAYSDGSEELYSLREDPFELDNRIRQASPVRVRRLRAKLTRLCDPPPPGFVGSSTSDPG